MSMDLKLKVLGRNIETVSYFLMDDVSVDMFVGALKMNPNMLKTIEVSDFAQLLDSLEYTEFNKLFDVCDLLRPKLIGQLLIHSDTTVENISKIRKNKEIFSDIDAMRDVISSTVGYCSEPLKALRLLYGTNDISDYVEDYSDDTKVLSTIGDILHREENFEAQTLKELKYILGLLGPYGEDIYLEIKHKGHNEIGRAHV